MKKIIPAVLAALLLAPVAFCSNAQEDEEPIISFTQTGESFELYKAHYNILDKKILENYYGWGEKPEDNYPRIRVTFYANSPTIKNVACDGNAARRANDAAMVRETMTDGSIVVVWRDQTDPNYSWFFIDRCGVLKDGATGVEINFEYLAQKDVFEKTQNAGKFSKWVAEIVAVPWPLQWGPAEN